MRNDYIVVDLEMTGLNPKKDRILEIGAVKVIEKQTAGTFSKLIRSDRKLDEKIVGITGITNEEALLGEKLDCAVEAFLEFAGDLTWIGHNIIFDYGFIRQWEINHRIQRTCYAVDTLKIARKCLPQLEKKTLDFLCGHYGIEREKKHRAFYDAAANRMLYERLEHEFIEKEPALFEKKELLYKAKRQTPATQRQKNYLKDLVKYHNIILKEPIDQLTRSEASRLTDQIIFRYGKR